MQSRTPPSLTPRFPQWRKASGKVVAYAHGHCLLCTDRGGDAARSGWLADKVGVRNIFFTAIVRLLSVHCFARFPAR